MSLALFVSFCSWSNVVAFVCSWLLFNVLFLVGYMFLVIFGFLICQCVFNSYSVFSVSVSYGFLRVASLRGVYKKFRC